MELELVRKNITRMVEPRSPSWETAADILKMRARRTPNRCAFVQLGDGQREEQRITYADLDARANEIGNRLQSRGLQGECALLACSTAFDFLASLFGCFYARVIAIPVEAPLRPRRISRLAAIMADSRASVLLAPGCEMTRPRIAAVSELDLDWIDVEFSRPSSVVDCRIRDLQSSDLAYLQYTSGSTGSPRGVSITHGNLISNLSLIHHGVQQTPESVGVLWLPFHHDMGLVNAVYSLFVGFPCVVLTPGQFIQHPLRWLETVSHYRATYSGGPNFAYELCTERGNTTDISGLDLSRWEVAFCGAEFVRAETLKEFGRCFAVARFHQNAFYPCYGLAEFTVAATGGSVNDPPTVRHVDVEEMRNGTINYQDSVDLRPTASIVGCGRSSPGHEVRIVDPVRRQPLNDKTIGEIWLAGPSRGQGYFGRVEESKVTFNACLNSGEGPYLRTGDLGFLDQGELFVTGRANDLIVLRGKKYYPDDIERIAETSHPSVAPGGCAAFCSNELADEGLVVVAELKRTARRNGNHSEIVSAIQEALLNCRDVVASTVMLVRPGQIARTPNGKIQRGLCRQRLTTLLDKSTSFGTEEQTTIVPLTQTEGPNAFEVLYK